MKYYLINIIKDNELVAIKTKAPSREEAIETAELIIRNWKFEEKLNLYLFDYDNMNLNSISIPTYSHHYKKTT